MSSWARWCLCKRGVEDPRRRDDFVSSIAAPTPTNSRNTQPETHSPIDKNLPEPPPPSPPPTTPSLQPPPSRVPPNTPPTRPQPHPPPHLLPRTPLLLPRMPHPVHQLVPPAPRPRRLALDQVPRPVALGLLRAPPQPPAAAVRGEPGRRRGLERDVQVRDQVDVVRAEGGVAVGAGAAEGCEGEEAHFRGGVGGGFVGWMRWVD